MMIITIRNPSMPEINCVVNVPYIFSLGTQFLWSCYAFQSQHGNFLSFYSWVLSLRYQKRKRTEQINYPLLLADILRDYPSILAINDTSFSTRSNDY